MYRYQIEELKRKELEKYNFIDNNNINKIKPKQDKRYVSLMGSMAHTYGNVLAWFQNYILDIMPDDLFKTIHVNSKIAHRQIKSTSHEFLKKTKPMIIFRPRIGSIDEDRFLNNTAMIKKQYDLYNTWGNTNLQPFFQDVKNDLVIKFQQNRSVMYVDVIMVFSTLMNQIDYEHYLQNAINWNSDVMVGTFLENYMPQEMLKIVSDISSIPLYDNNNSTKDFLTYMEQNSNTPITYKLQGSSGTKEFYRYYHTDIDMVLTDLSRDDGERVGQIMNSYQISFTARLEFYSTGFYYIFSDNIFDIKLPTVNLDEGHIIPVFTDVLTKEDLNLKPGWHLYNRASCMLEKSHDNINISEMVNSSIKNTINYHKDNGLPLIEFLDIKIRRQGEILREGIDYSIDYNNFIVYFNNDSTYFTYRILICVNAEYINDLMKTVYKLK